MKQDILVSLTGVLKLGISKQWTAWRTKLPAILLHLGFGIITGPIAALL